MSSIVDNINMVDKKRKSGSTINFPRAPLAKSKRVGLFELLCSVYLVCVFAMPQYFGFELAGFALTAQRLLMCLVALAICLDRDKIEDFVSAVKKGGFLLALLPLLFVLTLTAFWNFDPVSFLNIFVDAIVPLYLMMYIASEVLGIKRVIGLLMKVLATVCIVAFIDAAIKYNPYELIHTISSIDGGSTYRASSYRTAAMCSHPIGFGMYLMLLTPLACIDYEKKQINLFQNWPVLLLACAAILFCGSRMPQCLFLIEVVLLFVLTERSIRSKCIPYVFFFLVTFAFLVVVFQDHSQVEKFIILPLYQIVDTVFSTELVLDRFGYWQWVYLQSWDYRDLLLDIFFLEELNPLIGMGITEASRSDLSYVIDGTTVTSIDNYYVMQFIQYSWIGVVTALVCFAAMLRKCIRGWRLGKSVLCLVMGIAFVLYFYNLWYVDDLGTFKYLFSLAGLVCIEASVCMKNKDLNNEEVPYLRRDVLCLTDVKIVGREKKGIDMEFSESLEVLKRKWYLFVIFPLIIGVGVGLYSWMFVEDEYSANATIYVSSESTTEDGVTTSDLSVSSSIAGDMQTLLTVDEITFSVAVAAGIENLDNYEIEVTSEVSSPRVVSIDVTGEDPAIAAAIATELIGNATTIAVETMGAKSVEVVSEVSVPVEASGPNRVAYALVGALGGLFLALAVVIILNALDSAVRSSKQAQVSTGLPVLARVPKIKKNDDVSADFLVSEGAASQMKNLAVGAHFANKGAKSITITSSLPTEGKTTVAMGYAWACAAQGKRVLLIDADMRNPSIGNRIKANRTSGITSLLLGQASLNQAVVQTLNKNVDFLDCGEEPLDSIAVLSSERFKALISMFEKSYDYVVIDLPPIGLFADAQVVSGYADAVLMVVQQGKSKLGVLSNSLEQLEASSSEVLGLVMNFCDDKDSSYGYGYGYGYAYGTHKETEESLDSVREKVGDLSYGGLNSWMKSIGASDDQVNLLEEGSKKRTERAKGSHAKR